MVGSQMKTVWHGWSSLSRVNSTSLISKIERIRLPASQGHWWHEMLCSCFLTCCLSPSPGPYWIGVWQWLFPLCQGAFERFAPESFASLSPPVKCHLVHGASPFPPISVCDSPRVLSWHLGGSSSYYMSFCLLWNYVSSTRLGTSLKRSNSILLLSPGRQAGRVENTENSGNKHSWRGSWIDHLSSLAVWTLSRFLDLRKSVVLSAQSEVTNIT